MLVSQKMELLLFPHFYNASANTYDTKLENSRLKPTSSPHRSSARTIEHTMNL